MQHCEYVIVFIMRLSKTGPEFLLAERGAGKYMGQTWQLIAGGIEASESAWQAAIREVREETSLEVVELFRLTPVSTFYRSDVDMLCLGIPFCAIVNADAKVRLDDENRACAWHSRDELPRRLMWPSDREAFNYMCTEILDNGAAKPYLRIEFGKP